ncbi:MAG: IS21 family transposase [Acidiferrobacterales bacterium]
MPISDQCKAQILRYYFVEHWRVGTIARQLAVHHSTVERVLREAGVEREHQRQRRSSMLDPYVALITQTLEQFPSLSAARLFDMVKARGYAGGPDHFRHRIAQLRPRRAREAYLRLRTLPGEEAQVDWAHFGKLTIGHAERPLMAFVMVLSYSRYTFLRFYLNATLANLVRGHVEAFATLGGCARKVLYDNMRSVVLERRADAIRFHPTLLELAAHYRFEPRPVALARGNEKGRVERMIRFVRDSFFTARSFRDLDDLNAQADLWCRTRAAERPCPEDRQRTVREVFDEERPKLLDLPDNPFPTEERVEVHIAKTPYARFDGNDYTVPHDCVGRTLVVVATLDTVRILDGNDRIASHPRSFERGQQIEDPAHIEALLAHKRQGREHRAKDRLHHAAPSAKALFLAAAERRQHLGVLTRGLIELLNAYGAVALEHAIAEALERDAAHLAGVRHLIDQHRQQSGQPPALALALPDDPRLRTQHVRAHDLADYDQLQSDNQHGCDDDGNDNP